MVVVGGAGLELLVFMLSTSQELIGGEAVLTSLGLNGRISCDGPCGPFPGPCYQWSCTSGNDTPGARRP